MVFSLGASFSTADKDRRRIGFLGFDGVRSLDITAPLEAFSAARNPDQNMTGKGCYETIVIGLNGRSFVSQSGVTFRAQETIRNVRDLDTIFVPGGDGLQRRDTLANLAAWLSTQAPHTRRIAAVCGGIYPLAQTGLLSGRQVTTHWRLVPDVARRFPKVRVDTSASFLKDGPFHTCGGGSAGIEMSLALINEDCGPQVALALARELVVRLRPSGEDNRNCDSFAYQADPMDKLAELPAWILAHVDDNLSVEVLANRTCLCPRHFTRVFKSVFKSTPADFVEQLRLKEARRRLQMSRNSIDSIAAAVGYASADAFRRAFERRVGVTPNNYRRRAWNRGETLSSASSGQFAL